MMIYTGDSFVPVVTPDTVISVFVCDKYEKIK
jgi:hypothetical protein